MANWNLIGVQGTVTTFDPWIACQSDPSSTVEAFSQAHFNLSIDVDTSAQMGWVKRRRPDGSVGIDYFIEFRGVFLAPNPYQMFVSGPPAGTSVTYVLQLNPSSGNWSASATYPGGSVDFSSQLSTFNAIYSSIYKNWNSMFGSLFAGATWQGEAYDLGSYMPGFSSNPCEFTGCKYLTTTSTSWISPGWSGLQYIPWQTDSNANSNITFTGHVQVWDTRSPHP